jgi:Dehydrogenases with different specificities (related to short-chain alcohol dehydrogenases)
LAKTALITGGTQGIGAVIATAFAQKGYNLAINCYNQETFKNGGEQTAQACRALGVEADCFVADVSDYAACEAMVKAVRERFGTVDVLVNNAGITRDNLLARMSEEQFDTVIAVNLKSVFNMTKLVGTIMMKQRGGHIINMSSVVGVYGNASQVNYAAAKAGIIGITKSTAKELGRRNVICNAIAPGPVESAMTDSLPEAVKEKMAAATCLGRFAKAEEVAQVALFLAETTYVTGQVIVADGGLA